jgi:hypothetical protein
MKFLIIALLFSLTAHASNFIPVSSVVNNTQAGYSLLADCQKASAPDEVCADIGNQPIKSFETYTYLADDETKPINSKSSVEVCIDQDDCLLKIKTKVCLNDEFPIYTAELELYCTKVIGYQQKTLKSIRQSSVLLTDYLAQKALKDAEGIQEQKLQEKIKLIDAGKRVVALLNLRNEPKNLTGEQIGQMVTTFASIKGLLETGSLKTAKFLIGQVVADGTIITEGDKTALIAELDRWIK